jgi:hypothetical protein
VRVERLLASDGRPFDPFRSVFTPGGARLSDCIR